MAFTSLGRTPLIAKGPQLPILLSTASSVHLAFFTEYLSPQRNDLYHLTNSYPKRAPCAMMHGAGIHTGPGFDTSDPVREPSKSQEIVKTSPSLSPGVLTGWCSKSLICTLAYQPVLLPCLLQMAGAWQAQHAHTHPAGWCQSWTRLGNCDHLSHTLR